MWNFRAFSPWSCHSVQTRFLSDKMHLLRWAFFIKRSCLQSKMSAVLNTHRFPPERAVFLQEHYFSMMSHLFQADLLVSALQLWFVYINSRNVEKNSIFIFITCKSWSFCSSLWPFLFKQQLLGKPHTLFARGGCEVDSYWRPFTIKKLIDWGGSQKYRIQNSEKNPQNVFVLAPGGYELLQQAASKPNGEREPPPDTWLKMGQQGHQQQKPVKLKPTTLKTTTEKIEHHCKHTWTRIHIIKKQAKLQTATSNQKRWYINSILEVSVSES